MIDSAPRSWTAACELGDRRAKKEGGGRGERDRFERYR